MTTRGPHLIPAIRVFFLVLAGIIEIANALEARIGLRAPPVPDDITHDAEDNDQHRPNGNADDHDSVATRRIGRCCGGGPTGRGRVAGRGGGGAGGGLRGARGGAWCPQLLWRAHQGGAPNKTVGAAIALMQEDRSLRACREYGQEGVTIDESAN